MDFDRKVTKLKDTIPTALVSLTILFINLSFFGLNNIIIAPYMTLTFIRMKNYIMIEKNIFKPLFIHLLIGILASIASLNVPSAIFINLISIFLLCYFLTDDYNPSSYFPYLMAFVFLQLFTTTVNEIPKRLLSITVSYIVVFLYLLLFSRKGVGSHIKVLIKNGRENILLQLKYLYIGDIASLKKAQFDLFEICKELNRVVYSSDKKEYYQFIILFQHFNNFINEFIENKKYLNENKVYIKKLNKLILKLDINKNCNLELYSNFITKFLKENSLNDKNINRYSIFILNYLISSMENIKPYKKNILKKIFDFKSSKEYFSKYKLSLNEFKIRFAIRLTLLLTVAFAFIKIFYIPKGYWIPMTIFLLTLPFYEDSKVRIKERFIGTVIGIILSFIIFAIFKNKDAHIIIIIISTILMYYFTDYKIMTIYITCYALAISTITMGDGEAVFLRIFYTGVSAIVVLFANKFIFPNKNHIELINMIHKLIELDEIMLDKIYDIINGTFDKTEIKRILFTSYLISGKLQMHFQKLNNKSLKNFIFKNNQFTTLIIHSAIVLSLEEEYNIDELYVKECVANMKNIFESIYNEKNNCCFNINIIKHKNNYKNYKLLECIRKASGVYDAMIELKKEI